jgi:hypothetical protein
MLIASKYFLICSIKYLSSFCPIEKEWDFDFLKQKQPSASIKPDNHTLK